MTTSVRTMSATVPRVPRRAGGAVPGSCRSEEPAVGAGGSPDGSDCGPVVVLTAPWCRVLLARAEPGASPRAAPRGSLRCADGAEGAAGRRTPPVDDVLVVGEALVDIVRRAD